MAKWYNAYLTDDEKRKQVGQKGITARRRKEQASDNSKDISNSGIVRGSTQKRMISNTNKQSSGMGIANTRKMYNISRGSNDRESLSDNLRLGQNNRGGIKQPTTKEALRSAFNKKTRKGR